MGKRIVIVGGVAGGASAAARMRRLSEDAEIILVERGEYVSFANCGLPYFIGGEIKERSKLLLRTPEALRHQLKMDVRVMTEAVGINVEAKTVTLRDTHSGKESVERYDALVLSPGAAPIRPPIPGIDLPEVFTLRSLPDMDAIVRAAKRASRRKAIILGAGFIGIEMAENLVLQGFQVVLVQRRGQVLPLLDAEMANYVQRELTAKGVHLYLNDTAAAIEKRQDDGVDVILASGKRIDGDLVIVSVGVKPEAALAKNAGMAMGKRGGIKVDVRMRTSASDVYAVGDAVEVVDFVTGEEMPVPLAGPANRQGRIAANVIMGRDDTFEPSQGTWIVRVFSLTAAGTGATERMLKAKDIAYEKIYLHPFSHATYFPGFAQFSLKLLFAPDTGRILGAQIVGADGVDKRIDVLATALRGKMTVYDLENLELAYAPPFGAAKDPVNMAGFVATNFLEKNVGLAHWNEVAKGPDPERQVLLDVRNPDEVAAGAYPNAVNIPLPQLRERLHELPRDKEIITACAVGLRGYTAARILMQNGFTSVRNLSGGYRTWLAGTNQ